MKQIAIIIIVLINFWLPNSAVAQDLLKNSDLSSVKSDNVSEADIAKLKAQLQN